MRLKSSQFLSMTMCKFLPVLHPFYTLIVYIIETVILNEIQSEQENMSLKFLWRRTINWAKADIFVNSMAAISLNLGVRCD